MQSEVDRRMLWLNMGAGAATWLVTGLLTGREPWDNGSYYLIWMPLMCWTAWYAGSRSPGRPWRWWLALVAGQLVGGMLVQGPGNLLLIGIIALGIMGLPMLGFAAWGSKRAKNRDAKSVAPT